MPSSNTCRESMDMLKGAPSISFLRGTSATGLIGISSFCKSLSNDDESSLGKPLISERILDEEVSTSTLPASQQRISVNGSTPSQKQCSFTQALVNGNERCNLSFFI